MKTLDFSFIGEVTTEPNGTIRQHSDGRAFEAMNGYWIPVPPEGWDRNDERVERNRERELVEAAEVANSNIAQRFDLIGIPERHRQILLTSQLMDTKAVRAVKRFLRSDALFCVLAGPPGTGKTLAGEYWLWRSRLGKYPRRRINAKELSATSDFDAEENIALSRASAMLIDDVGRAQGKSDWDWQKVEELICRRHDWMVPTVITTNLTIAAFSGHAGGRVVSRINGSGGMVDLSSEFDLRKVGK